MTGDAFTIARDKAQAIVSARLLGLDDEAVEIGHELADDENLALATLLALVDLFRSFIVASSLPGDPGEVWAAFMQSIEVWRNEEGR